MEQVTKSGPSYIRVPKDIKGEGCPKKKHNKQDNWPKEKSELMNKYLKCFIKFTNAIYLTRYERDCYK